MGANYQKLYTYLVAKVDNAIQLIDMVAVKGTARRWYPHCSVKIW